VVLTQRYCRTNAVASNRKYRRTANREAREIGPSPSATADGRNLTPGLPTTLRYEDRRVALSRHRDRYTLVTHSDGGYIFIPSAKLDGLPAAQIDSSSHQERRAPLTVTCNPYLSAGFDDRSKMRRLGESPRYPDLSASASRLEHHSDLRNACRLAYKREVAAVAGQITVMDKIPTKAVHSRDYSEGKRAAFLHRWRRPLLLIVNR
jgi:hypothetical protein